jgi:hypothetical protein
MMAKPLVVLDEQGTPAVIRYNIPEPTSYSGRHIVELQLPDEAYTVVVATPPAIEAALSRGETEPGSAAAIDGRSSAHGPNGVPHGPGRLLTASVVAPEGVVLGAGEPHVSPIRSSPLPISDRLAALTNADVQATVSGGKRVVVYPNISGQLDYFAAPAYEASAIALKKPIEPLPGDPGPDPTVPEVSIWISSPTNEGPPLPGTVQGANVPVVGTWSAASVTSVTIELALDDVIVPVEIDRKSSGDWSTNVKVMTSGLHTLRATIQGRGPGPSPSKPQTVSETATTTFTVLLDIENPDPPPVLPTVTISEPRANTMIVSSSGVATLPVMGTATSGPERTLKEILITDEATGQVVQASPVGGAPSTWSSELLLNGLGLHRISVRAADDINQVSAPQSVAVRVTNVPAFRRLKNRLLIVETLNISSFLGSFGAGRVIKTFSLLPGEKTSISLKSWTKSAQSRKEAASIVDSDATEAASSFEDAISAEQTRKEARSESTNYSIDGKVGASWSWGTASISASHSGAANSAREQAVKNVTNATRKHSLKASSNRNVSINTEYSATEEAETEDLTIREISNINVSRTLNFVFRQMNQQHITLIHLTDVRVAYYAEDLMLDAQGNPANVPDELGNTVLDIRPSYTEVTLPELMKLLGGAISPPFQERTRNAIMAALSGIPDYTSEAINAFELVEPKDKEGNVIPNAEYIRFPPDLKKTYVDEHSGQEFTVPGVLLAANSIVMRTDAVMVDTIIGAGSGLDAYSQGLQEVAIKERQVAVAERQAEVDRLDLARSIVRQKDKEQAAIFATVFHPPVKPKKDPTPPPE